MLNVDSDMKLWVYTFFNWSSESCTEVNDITLMDGWLFLHKDTSPRTLTCFQETSVRVLSAIL
jgi:hypothetical protein